MGYFTHCDPVTFHNVTRKKFDCLKSNLAKKGFKVPAGDSGEIRGTVQGFEIIGKIKWTSDRNLWIKITKKPAAYPCSKITTLIQNSIAAC